MLLLHVITQKVLSLTFVLLKAFVFLKIIKMSDLVGNYDIKYDF